MGVAWSVTPDVERYDEAVDWFLKRTVVRASDAREADDRIKQQAFWVGGGLQLTQVQRVFDKIDTAIQKGTTLEEFKKAVVNELRNPHHVETVFRNATQRAYNAGRWQQMHEPSVLRFRPYGLVDAILDNRTTPYCNAVNGTLLPLDDPWWATHWFPAHHRCRTSVRNIRKSEAERRGVKLPPEGQDPAKGFGLSPKSDNWKPDPKKHDSALYQQLELKFPKASKARKPVTDVTRPKLDTAKYLPEFQKKGFGEASKSLAHGKAALEFGLDMPVSLVRAELAKLGIAKLLEAVQDADADRTLREQAGETDPLRKAAAALAGHLHTLVTRKRPLSHPDLLKTAVGRQALDFFTKASGKGVKQPIKSWSFVHIPPHERAGMSQSLKRIRYHDERASLWHEWGHALEEVNPDLLKRAEAFLRGRTAGHALEKLNVLEPHLGYGDSEKTRPDAFFDSYVGKAYEDATGKAYATEVTSMGVQALVRDPDWGTLQKLMVKDPEHFLFILGQLAGP